MKKYSYSLLFGILVLALLGICIGAVPGANYPSEKENGNKPFSPELATLAIRSTVPCDPESEDLLSLGVFAWEQFLALNWQASWGQRGANSQKRDFPDPNWNPNKPYSSDFHTVWETYAHLTELRPKGNRNLNHMQPFDDSPYYSYKNEKSILKGPGNPSFTLFNNLDEDNEIGSCNVYPPGQYRKELVLYQAKCNRVEYEYRKKLFGTEVELGRARKRTKNYIKQYKKYYPTQGSRSSCNCPEDVICLPCGGSLQNDGTCSQGAIEIKTAWRKRTPQDDPTQFFTRTNLYYQNQTDAKGNPILDKSGKPLLEYRNDEFVLIGIHIIRKTEKYPEFIFTSFQHKSVKEADYTLNWLVNAEEENTYGVRQPARRRYPVPQALRLADQMAYNSIGQGKTAFQIWKNYELIGVQGPLVDYANRNENEYGFNEQYYFMANKVIESDLVSCSFDSDSRLVKISPIGLANFHGTGFAGSSAPFPNKNILQSSSMKTYDMGGCKGCHGVAQTFLGTDFSFLLDGDGKPAELPSSINGVQQFLNAGSIEIKED